MTSKVLNDDDDDDFCSKIDRFLELRRKRKGLGNEQREGLTNIQMVRDLDLLVKKLGSELEYFEIHFDFISRVYFV